MTEDEQNKVYNTIGLAPNISMPVKGDASSTTKSVVAAGTIDIRENKAQDISALSRDTANSLNELGKSSKKRGLNLKLLDNVVEALGQGHKLDAKYRDHTLHGNEKIPPVVK